LPGAVRLPEEEQPFGLARMARGKFADLRRDKGGLRIFPCPNRAGKGKPLRMERGFWQFWRRERGSKLFKGFLCVEGTGFLLI